MIPRRRLFGNAAVQRLRVSPDGRWLAWLAPRDGVMNVWVAPVAEPSSPRALTSEPVRGVRSFVWAPDARAVIHERDNAGDENNHLVLTPLEAGASARDLTPFEGARAFPAQLSGRVHGRIVAGMNDRDRSQFDYHAIDLSTGKRELLVQNDDGLATVLFDDDLAPRLALRTKDDESADLLVPEGRSASRPTWRVALTMPAAEARAFTPIALDGTGTRLLARRPAPGGMQRLVLLDIATWRELAALGDDDCDLSTVLVDPRTGLPAAASFTHLRARWRPFPGADPGACATLTRMQAALDADVEVHSTSDDFRLWTVISTRDDAPPSWHLLDGVGGAVLATLPERPDLMGVPLSRTRGAIISARDGLALPVYVTMPRDSAGPAPCVVLVHGGPWWRDFWGFNDWAQWLAGRGYAVLSVNFRGSTGFGSHFTDAGDREWGCACQRDLYDAHDWAVREGIADPARTAIMGGSYGGYAVLAALAFEPTRFACGLELFGPSNLVSLLDSLPPYWRAGVAKFRARVGDNTTEEGRAFLASRSPINSAAGIERPLLVAQGANDVRVTRSESDQIASALAARGVPVTYLLFGDEGHGFERPENRMAFFAVAEAFLARHIGGQCEPPRDDDFAGSSMEVVHMENGLRDVVRGGR